MSNTKGVIGIQLDRLYYPVKTLGYGDRVGIWTVGCPRRCVNCSNPELWEPNSVKEIPCSVIINALSKITQRIDGVTVTGGEPLLQPDALAEIVAYLNSSGINDILVYTGYTIEQLYSMENKSIDYILKNIGVLVDGPYCDELNDNKPLRGSSNQRVLILKPELEQRYEAILNERSRSVQNVLTENSLMSIGIPVKEYRSGLRNELSKKGIAIDFY